MRILDEGQDKSLDCVTLYLTKTEAAELRDSLTKLLESSASHHEHVPSDDYQKELTICVYDTNLLNQFNDRSKRLILEDT